MNMTDKEILLEFTQYHTTFFVEQSNLADQYFLLHFVIAVFHSNVVHIKKVCENKGLDY